MVIGFFLGGANRKESACQSRRCKRAGFDSWVREVALDKNGNPLQYYCLEDPMEGGVWRAIACGVAKSWTQLSDWVLVDACSHM